MKYKKIYNLKQITPIIVGIKSEEDSNVAIRPTELKPKLDTFLVYVLKKEYGILNTDIRTKLPGSWISDSENNEKISFRYKIKLKIKEKVKLYLLKDKKAPLYLANMDKKNDKFKFKYFHSNDNEGVLELSFLALTEEVFEAKTGDKSTLLEFIDKYIAAFFEFNNFGARSSKGFGSFEIVDVNKNSNMKETVFPPNYKMTFSKKNGAAYKGYRGIEYVAKMYYLTDIARLNKALKDYICNCDEYKSNNDKEFIIKLKKGDVKKDYKFVRFFLGLSNHYGKVNVSSKNNEIERFQTPIIFKIKSDGSVLLIPKYVESSKDLLEKEFIFRKESNGEYILKTPDKFNIEKLLDNFLKSNINTKLYNHEFKKIEYFKAGMGYMDIYKKAGRRG